MTKHTTTTRYTAHKARWAGGGSGLGTALAVIAVWIGGQLGFDMEPIEPALAVVFGAIGAFIGAYIASNEPKP